MPPKIDLAAKLAEMTAKTKKAPSKRKEKTTASKVVRISVPEDERPAKKLREDAQIPDETEKLSPGSEQTNIEMPEIEVLTRPWSPKLVNAEGRSIMNTDSVRADSRLGLGLLPALALKNDMALVPSKIEDNLYHCSSLLVQTGQSMLRLHDQVVELNGAAKRYKHRADAALEKVQTAEGRAEELRAENERLKKDLAEWRVRSDRRLESVKAEHLKAIEEARELAYNAGFAAAGDAYAGDILRLVKAGEQKGFGKGYLHCCEVFGVASEHPKFAAPPMPDSPAAEDLDDDEEEDEETEKSSADGPAKKITDEGTSSQQIPSENSADKTIDPAP